MLSLLLLYHRITYYLDINEERSTLPLLVEQCSFFFVVHLSYIVIYIQIIIYFFLFHAYLSPRVFFVLCVCFNFVSTLCLFQLLCQGSLLPSSGAGLLMQTPVLLVETLVAKLMKGI